MSCFLISLPFIFSLSFTCIILPRPLITRRFNFSIILSFSVESLVMLWLLISTHLVFCFLFSSLDFSRFLSLFFSLFLFLFYSFLSPFSFCFFPFVSPFLYFFSFYFILFFALTFSIFSLFYFFLFLSYFSLVTISASCISAFLFLSLFFCGICIFYTPFLLLY